MAQLDNTIVNGILRASTAAINILRDSAGSAGTTNLVLTVNNAGNVVWAGSVWTGYYASSAGMAAYASSATLAAHASCATWATSAGYASSAGSANSAGSAGYASYAVSSGSAGYASSAGSSTSAANATLAATALKLHPNTNSIVISCSTATPASTSVTGTVCIGRNAKAVNSSVVIGDGAGSDYYSGIMIGQGASSLGNNSIAIGNSVYAAGLDSIAIGASDTNFQTVIKVGSTAFKAKNSNITLSSSYQTVASLPNPCSGVITWKGVATGTYASSSAAGGIYLFHRTGTVFNYSSMGGVYLGPSLQFQLSSNNLQIKSTSIGSYSPITTVAVYVLN